MWKDIKNRLRNGVRVWSTLLFGVTFVFRKMWSKLNNYGDTLSLSRCVLWWRVKPYLVPCQPQMSQVAIMCFLVWCWWACLLLFDTCEHPGCGQGMDSFPWVSLWSSICLAVKSNPHSSQATLVSFCAAFLVSHDILMCLRRYSRFRNNSEQWPHLYCKDIGFIKKYLMSYFNARFSLCTWISPSWEVLKWLRFSSQDMASKLGQILHFPEK